MKLALLMLTAGLAMAQTNVLSVAPPEKLRVKRGDAATVKVHARLQTGYHVNSNKPSEDYMIPLKLTWTADPLVAGDVTYPKPQMEPAAFSPTPVSVFTGEFDILTRFSAPAKAPSGLAMVTGKLRYQACNDRMCLPPKTIEVPLTVEIQ